MKWITSVDLAVSVEGKQKKKEERERLQIPVPSKAPCHDDMGEGKYSYTHLTCTLDVNGRLNVPAALSPVPVG